MTTDGVQGRTVGEVDTMCSWKRLRPRMQPWSAYTPPSKKPIREDWFFVEVAARVEPAHSGFADRRVNHFTTRPAPLPD